MTFRFVCFIFLALALSTASPIFGQANTLLAQITNSTPESIATSVSGDGRFVVFESRGNLATVNPRNADANLEIFLWDYAQRQIFQITNTKSVLFDTNGSTTLPSNVRIEIVNRRPVISYDGRWIAFSSNATSSTPSMPNNTNPGDFNGNALSSPTPTPVPTASPTPVPSPTPTPAANPLTGDANLEIWMYQIPAYAPADLRTGEEIPFVELAGGAFTAVTNTLPSLLPQPGSTLSNPFVADDNHQASINDDGSIVAFTSTRDLAPCVGNSFSANEDNDEIFTFTRGASVPCPGGLNNIEMGAAGVRQVTKTLRGTVTSPIYNKNPTISGNGSRVAFASTGDGPIRLMQTGGNPANSRNEEIFYADLVAGEPTAASLKKQVTTTTPATPGAVVNALDPGKRMSRNGRYIAFDSFADLGTMNTNLASFALYLYDATTDTFKRVGPRSDADSGATGGDVNHHPGFTDYDDAGNPATLVLETRLNINAAGVIPGTASEGLNPDTGRPAQIYMTPIGLADGDPLNIFTRLTKLPGSSSLFAQIQPLTSATSQRMAFNLSFVEPGTGNPDLNSEMFYLYRPLETSTSIAALSFFTGASRLPVNATPTPSPSPTASPSPSPSPSPTATPSPGGSPTPTPTPVTPSAVLGISPGSLAVVAFSTPQPNIVSRTAVGSLTRRPTLPIELSGVTMSINGLACGIRSVSPQEIVFVLPPFISSAVAGTAYPVVVNNNGVAFKTDLTIIPSRPDVFTSLGIPGGPGGRAALENVTNRVHTTEPFTVTTILIRGGRRVPSRLRLRLTGVAGTTPGVLSVRIGSVTIASTTGAVEVEPGIYTIDFDLPATLNMAGDQPVVVTVNVNGTLVTSRLDDTAPRVFIL